MTKIWIDIKNVHEPLFFQSIMKGLKGHDFYVTCRDFAEIIGLLERYQIEHSVVGGRPEGSMLKRKLGFTLRSMSLSLRVPKYDFSLSHSSIWAVYASKMRFRKNITFTDNDISHSINRSMFKNVNYLITPNCIPKEVLITDGAKANSIIQFSGFKEDIYAADYVHDPIFLDKLPFKDFVTVRPESLQATYVPKGTVSIVPELLKELSKNEINVLYLPRYESDRKFAKGFSNVFIPPGPLNGLDVCHYSRAVLTGAGTFSREAAVVGTPAVSFYPGKEILSVDKEMFKKGWILHSRNPKDIVNHALESKKRKDALRNSSKVKNAVINIMNKIIG